MSTSVSIELCDADGNRVVATASDDMAGTEFLMVQAIDAARTALITVYEQRAAYNPKPETRNPELAAKP